MNETNFFKVVYSWPSISADVEPADMEGRLEGTWAAADFGSAGRSWNRSPTETKGWLCISPSQWTKLNVRRKHSIGHGLARTAGEKSQSLSEWPWGCDTGVASAKRAVGRGLGSEARQSSTASSFRVWVTESHLSWLADSSLIWRVWWILPALSWRFSLVSFLGKVNDPRDLAWDLAVASKLYEIYILGQIYNIMLQMIKFVFDFAFVFLMS